MSSIQLDDERDGEALRRAQRAHEPSMEEILASIRAIIADDKAVAAAKVAIPARPATAAGSQVIYSAFGQKPLEHVSPTVVRSRSDDGDPQNESTAVEDQPHASEPQGEQGATEPPLTARWVPPDSEEAPAAHQEALPAAREAAPNDLEPPSAREEAPTSRPKTPLADAQDSPPGEEAPLLSLDADRIVAASFHALAASLAIPDAQRVEEMSRELLRPMLKVWLDENLPSLVERLVRAEIQRVARGSR